jgi:hypothetical protein
MQGLALLALIPGIQLAAFLVTLTREAWIGGRAWKE